MNLKKILGLILCLLFIRSLSSSLQPQQIVRDARMSKKELIKIWKEWMKKFPMPEDAIELEVEKSFPPEDLAEKGIYLWQPLGITSLSNGNIVINDKKLSQVLVFDAKGNFIQKIGRKGQGPAEFGNPFYDDVMQVLSLAPPFFSFFSFFSPRSCEPSFYPCP